MRGRCDICGQEHSADFPITRHLKLRRLFCKGCARWIDKELEKELDKKRREYYDKNVAPLCLGRYKNE